MRTALARYSDGSTDGLQSAAIPTPTWRDDLRDPPKTRCEYQPVPALESRLRSKRPHLLLKDLPRLIATHDPCQNHELF